MLKLGLHRIGPCSTTSVYPSLWLHAHISSLASSSSKPEQVCAFPLPPQSVPDSDSASASFHIPYRATEAKVGVKIDIIHGKQNAVVTASCSRSSEVCWRRQGAFSGLHQYGFAQNAPWHASQCKCKSNTCSADGPQRRRNPLLSAKCGMEEPLTKRQRTGGTR